MMITDVADDFAEGCGRRPRFDGPDCATRRWVNGLRALTPGRRCGYAIALSSAKKPETRTARILRFRVKIFAGKGALER